MTNSKFSLCVAEQNDAQVDVGKSVTAGKGSSRFGAAAVERARLSRFPTPKPEDNFF